MICLYVLVLLQHVLCRAYHVRVVLNDCAIYVCFARVVSWAILMMSCVLLIASHFMLLVSYFVFPISPLGVWNDNCVLCTMPSCPPRTYLLTQWCAYLLTYVLTYWLTYLLNHLLTYSITYLLTYLLTYFLSFFLTCSLT